MKLAIMQPYFFPYLGYFQLISAVDAFVVYDDVNFIKGGWINRNYILQQGCPQLISLQTQGASPNKLINEVEVGKNHEKLLKTIQHNYSKSPYFTTVFPLLNQILRNSEKNLSKFLIDGLKHVCTYLDIKPLWYTSSDIKKDNNLRGQDKVLAVCDILGATHYINLPGGKNLYDDHEFHQKGIKLSFIKMESISYQQFTKIFVPNLSIIDVMMFNSAERCGQLLRNYELV